MISRSKSAAHRVLMVLFMGAVLASIGAALTYLWFASSPLVYYVTMRPAYVWFGAVAVLLVVGAFGVKGKVFLAGAAIWLVCFFASEEVLSLGRGMFGGSGGTARQQSTRGGQPAEESAVGVFRAVTWNISANPESIDAVLEQIAELDADILFLQECSTGDMLPVAIARHPGVARYAVVRSIDDAMFSRFAIAAVDEPRIGETDGHVCSVEMVPGVKATCINVHFPPPALVDQVWPAGGWESIVTAEREARERMANLKAVVEDYAQVGPVILAGDFNMPANYAGLRGATKVLADSFLAAGHGWGKTVPATFPMSRIDVMYLSKHFKARECRAVGTLFSDHRPVVADVEFLGEGQ